VSGYTGLLQPIVVRRTGTHEDMVTAAARASVAAWMSCPDDPAWEPWLAGSFGKSVRRARPVEIEKAREFMVASVAVGEAEAFAGLPVSRDDMPPAVRKLQVSGTDAPRAGWPKPVLRGMDLGGVVVPWVSINLGAQMTTGKTCAQAAHGLLGWALRKEPAVREAWASAGMPVNVGEFSAEDFDNFVKHARTDAIIIQDAGHTEVVPGTTTVLVTD
jgi:peptidyl-tRNA hydrolase